ncbi:MAG: ADP-ribosylglycohydrolase family protein [Bacteroides stercoris]
MLCLDKVKGAWAGQVIGCTYGGPTEFRYLSTMIPDSIVMPWGPGEIKKWFDGGGGLYDDVYVDLTFIETMERCGLDTPADSFAVDFLAKRISFVSCQSAGQIQPLAWFIRSRKWLLEKQSACQLLGFPD